MTVDRSTTCPARSTLATTFSPAFIAHALIDTVHGRVTFENLDSINREDDIPAKQQVVALN
jgi:hypothetical protein